MEVPKNAISIAAYWTWMDKDGIARTKVKPHIDITLNHALENTEAVSALNIDKKFPILIDARGIKSMSREAREHFSGNGREVSTIAFGIIIKSPLSRVIGNFFLGVNKPSVPTRLFDNEQDAVDWLKQYV